METNYNVCMRNGMVISVTKKTVDNLRESMAKVNPTEVKGTFWYAGLDNGSEVIIQLSEISHILPDPIVITKIPSRK